MQQALTAITDQLAQLTATQQVFAQQVNSQGDQLQQFTALKTSLQRLKR